MNKDDLEKIDDILVSGNESYTGLEIRQRLYEAGFLIVKNDEPPNGFSCHICGCEMPKLSEYTGWCKP